MKIDDITAGAIDIELRSGTGTSNAVALNIKNESNDHSNVANGFGSRIQFQTNRGTHSASVAASADIKGYIYSGAGTTGDWHALDLDVYGDNSVLNRGISILSQSATAGTPANVVIHGNLGIGKEPDYTLEVDGELRTKSNVFLDVMNTHEREGTVRFGRADGGDRVHNIKVYNSSTQEDNYLKFQVHAGGASTGTVTDNVLYLRGDGNVGVGTATPTEKLHVHGNAIATDLIANQHVSIGTNLHPTLGGHWLTIVSPTFDDAIGDNHPDPDGGILFTNKSSTNYLPWGYYMGVVKDVAGTNGTTQRLDIGKSSSLNSQSTTTGTDTLTPYLTIDNGSVGIGNTTPTCMLTVDGGTGVPSSGGVLGIRQKGDTSGDGITLTSSHANSTRMYKDSDGDFHLYNAGGGTLTLTNGDGLVGIGTTSPSTKLHLHTADSANAGGTEGDYVGTHDTTEMFRMTGGSNAGDVNAISAAFKIGGDYPSTGSSPHGRLDIYANTGANSGNDYGLIPDTHVASFRGDGKVGIGVSNPAYTLDVDGDVNLSSGSTLRINGTPAVFSNWTTASGSNIYRSSGNVGIGVSNPGYKLDVAGDANVEALTASSFVTERVIFRESWPNESLTGDLGTWVSSGLVSTGYGTTPDGYRSLEFKDDGTLTSATFDLRKYALVDTSHATNAQTKTCTRVFLKAWLNSDSLDDEDTDPYMYIEFSADNGTTWHKVYSDNSNEDTGTDAGWKMAVADLSPYINATSTSCKIRFSCNAPGVGDFYKIGRIFIYESGVPTNLGGMWLGTDGNIGVGTTSPSTYKLDVNGSLRAVSWITADTGIIANATSSRDKLRVWNSSHYSMGMESGITFGALNDYGMTFQMSNTDYRGFWWGDSSHSKAQGAMSLTTTGHLTVAERLKVGDGQSSTSGPSYTLHTVSNDTVGDANYYGAVLRHICSGSDTLSAIRTHYGLHLDMDSSASGGDTTNQHRMLGISADVRHTGSSDYVRGVSSYVVSEHTSGTCTYLWGGNFQAKASGTGTNAYVYGAETLAYKDSGSTGTTTSMFGVSPQVRVDGGTCTNAYGVRSYVYENGGTITNGFCFYGLHTGNTTNKWGVYITGETKNYFSGRLGIGINNPSGELHVKGENIYLQSNEVSNCTWRIMPQSGNTTKLFRIYDHDNSLDRLVIDASGKVGIGTTSPDGKFHIYQSAGNTNLVDKRTNRSTTDYAQHINYTHYASVAEGSSRNPDNSRGLWVGNFVDENDVSPSGANFMAFTNSFTFYGVDDNTEWDSDLSFTSNTDDLKYSGGTFTKCVRIDAGGNVGIGVTDPDQKLEVRGNIKASSSDTNHGMLLDAGGTLRRDWGGAGVGLHFTSNAIWPTNYLGTYSSGGVDLGSGSYRWNNVYTEALNASGDLVCRLVRPNYTDQSTISGAIAYRINNSNDNYVRFCSDTGAIRTFLDVPTRTGGNASGTWGISITGNAATASAVTGKSRISKTAPTFGSNDYHLELYSGNTGDASKEIALRFQQSNNYWHSIRAKNTGFYFTDGYSASTLSAIHCESVGIGITSTQWAKLHVDGYRSSTMTSGSLSYFTHGYGLSYTSSSTWTNYATSIFATDDIISRGYILSSSGNISVSDSRIKKNIVDADDAECLEVLRQLKPKKYQYKDTIKRGEEPVWGFIAQEVRDTLPYATKLRQDFIPNIYELASVSQSNVITFTNFNTSNLESNATTLIQTTGIDGKEHRVHLVEVIDDHTIRVEEDLSEWIGSVDETGNVVTGNQLFVHGQQVNDFVFLKKESIFTVATAALQEVDRQQQADKARIAELETQLASVLARLDALENPPS